MHQDSAQAELARLRWQCRRGMLELDALLGEFVEKYYETLSVRQRESLHVVLQYPDQLLFDYFFGDSIPIDKDVADVIQRIRRAVTPGT